jgi:hypothetical protein
MKSQINLLQAEFTPRFEWVSGSHLFGLVIVTLLLSGLSYAVSFYWYAGKVDEVAEIRTLINGEQAIVEELSSILANRKVDPRLESKRANFIALTQSRSILLNQISHLSGPKQTSFSTLFDSFSQAHSSELWLTDFLVNRNQLTINGQVTRPKALPMWISQLSKTPFFVGQQFDDASVSREQDVLRFSLNSKTDEIDDIAFKGAQRKNIAHAAATEVQDERN